MSAFDIPISSQAKVRKLLVDNDRIRASRVRVTPAGEIVVGVEATGERTMRGVSPDPRYTGRGHDEFWNPPRNKRRRKARVFS